MACWKCHSTYDCLDAVWCFCVTHDQTIICPSCMTCACRASAEIRKEFWSKAPRALRLKRIERSRSDHERRRAQEAQPQPAGKPIVLIADDSRTIRILLRQVVENVGCDVAEAADGEEALRLARALHPKLVIADALMPKLDGRELARTLKDDPSTHDIRVVIVSGLYTSRRYSSEALSTFSADAYLTKPFDPARLEAIVTRLTLSSSAAAPQPTAMDPSFAEQVA